MADVTYYVAMPFLQDDTGSPVAGAAEECQSSSGALRRAEVLSRAAGSIGAVAFSRTGDPLIGEFGDAQLLRKFGSVPDDLSGLRSIPGGPRPPPWRHRSSRKKARTSSASSSGCSSAAKCPPLGMMLQRLISVNTRAAAERGGLTISRGNSA